MIPENLENNSQPNLAQKEVGDSVNKDTKEVVVKEVFIEKIINDPVVAERMSFLEEENKKLKLELGTLATTYKIKINNLNDEVTSCSRELKKASLDSSEGSGKTGYADERPVYLEDRINTEWGRRYDQWKSSGSFNFSNNLKDVTDELLSEYKLYNSSFMYPRFEKIDEQIQADPSLEYAKDPFKFIDYWESWISKKYDKKFKL